MRTADPTIWQDLGARLLGQRTWAHTTPRLTALGWDFAVRTNDAVLGRHLDHVFGEMATEGEPAHVYSFVVTDRGSWQRHRLYRDGYRMLDTPDPSRAFLHLLWDVNQRVFRNTPDKLLVHAGAVVHEGRAVIMSAPSESGKTTLSVGLVERGLGYLTDEAAAIDPDTMLVHPFPKSLSVDTGAQPFLERFRPDHEIGIERYLRGQWQVAPNRIRAGATSAPVPPGWVVLPRYVRGGETKLTPLKRSDALSLLLEQGLNLHVHGRRGFECLAEVVRRSQCFHLIMADLPSACDTLLAALDEGGPAV